MEIKFATGIELHIDDNEIMKWEQTEDKKVIVTMNDCTTYIVDVKNKTVTVEKNN